MMDKKPIKGLVSVVMPAYNSQNYIGEAIASVSVQTYRNLELLVIDDGSVDETEAVVRLLMKEDSRIRLIFNGVNRGISYSRNRGIECSQGEWIAFLDSDDMWDLRKLEKQMNYAENSGASFLFSGSRFIRDQGRLLSPVLHVPERITRSELLKQNVISCSSVLIRRELLSSCQIEGAKLHEDFALWLEILRREQYAYGIDEPLLCYRLTQESKSSNKWKAACMTWRVYRSAGLNRLESAYYWSFYVCRSLKKYAMLWLD